MSVSETPEQTAALNAVEKVIDALSEEQRAALEQYLQEHETPPNSAAEAVALIPVIHKAIEAVTSKGIPARAPNAAQTVPSNSPLRPLSR